MLASGFEKFQSEITWCPIYLPTAVIKPQDQGNIEKEGLSWGLWFQRTNSVCPGGDAWQKADPAEGTAKSSYLQPQIGSRKMGLKIL